MLQRSILPVLIALVMTGASLSLLGPPAPPAAATSMAPAPSWMDSDTAARLALDFDVLVPGWIPAPFTDQPAITANGGYYELYWVITGGNPTFLDVTGSVGGDIPDFSWYDRNNQLEQNANVGGVPAYRDLTPIYDNVYWQVGNVVYTVSSQGLTETDSLSLANALVILDGAQEQVPSPPSPPEPATLAAPETVSSGSTISVTVSNGGEATLNATNGTFSDTGGGSYDGLSDATVSWTAPSVTSEQAVTFSLIDPATGSWLAGATTIVIPPAPPSLALTCGESVASGEQVVVTVAGAGSVVVEASSGFWPAFGANVVFDADAGDSRLTGVITGGSATLLWQAPVADEALNATITASGMSGAATAICSIAVTPARTSPAPTRTPVPNSTDQAAAPATRTVPAGATRSGQPSTVTPRSTGEASTAGRNRPTPSVGVATPTPAATVPSRLRLPESDGTGGPVHPRYVGAPGGVDTLDPLIAPTSAPMPSAPRAIRTGALTAPSDTRNATATATPVASTSMDAVEAVVGPAGGSVRHPNGALLTVPAGTFSTPSRVLLRPVSNSELPQDATVSLIPGTGYDIEVADSAGRPVTRLAQPVTLDIPIAANVNVEDAAVYAIENDGLAKVETHARATRLQASLTHFSRFAAGEIDTQQGMPTWLLPWLVIAGTALAILIASTITGTFQRRRVALKRRSRQ